MVQNYSPLTEYLSIVTEIRKELSPARSGPLAWQFLWVLQFFLIFLLSRFILFSLICVYIFQVVYRTKLFLNLRKSNKQHVKGTFGVAPTIICDESQRVYIHVDDARGV